MSRVKILIVENDEDEQFFMEEGFRSSENFELIAILKNGDALFRWFEENPVLLPEIILSDLNMPGKNGYDIILKILETPALRHIPVIITSTSSTTSIMEKCLRIGAAGYLVKPDTFIEYGPFAEKLHSFILEKELVKQKQI